MKQDSETPTNKVETIAIIGLSCFFPGSGSPAGYWSAIRDGRDALGDVPADHWLTADYYDPDPKALDKTYGRRGGFLDKIPFEPLKYGIVPNDLAAIDSTQLLGLVAADRALADAGYPAGGSYGHGRTAVMLGVTGALKMVVSLGSRLAHPQLKRALRDSGVDEELSAEIVKRFANEFTPWQENSFPGLLGNVTAGRVANRLNLGGTNLVVDAACASSLAAIRQGVMELRGGQADLVVSGGVDTFSDPFMYTCFSKTPALSPTGDVRAYDQDGDGTMLGEGVGVVVMKRLSEAKRDGDRVFAVIRGIGSSSDGKGTAIFAPSVDGQARALENAYREAGVSPATVGLVEGHGTGTAVGDTVEVEALSRVFRAAGGSAKNGQPWCALGSVKSQIGHSKAAAGVAGLIKAALALYFKVLPPTAKVKKPLSPLNSNKSPFYLSSAPRPWLAKGEPRRAAVSAFGFGGSNFHCVLEEANPAKPLAEGSADIDIFAFSGASHSGLSSSLEQLLKREDHLADLALSSRRGFSPAHACRLVLAGPTGELRDLARKALNMLAVPALKEKDIPVGVYFQSSQPVSGPYGFLCPGAESVTRNMFLELAGDWPEMIEALSEAETALQKYPELSPLSLALYPPDLAAREYKAAWATDFKDERLRARAAQAVNQGLGRVLARFGLKAAATAGDAAALENHANQAIKLWLEIGPGQALSQIAAKNGSRVLALDQTGGGRLDLARFLARLASWGLPVDFSAWPNPVLEAPAGKSGESRSSTGFTINISGANSFTKQEIPPSPPRTLYPAPPPLEAIAAPENAAAARLEALGRETARLHQEFLATQNETLRLLSQSLGEGKTAPIAQAAPSAATQPKAPALAALEILKTVASETGYPLDMLTLDMNLESDLGLDSIKKVEIMALLSERWPDVSGFGAESMNSVETLRDLVALAGEKPVAAPMAAVAPAADFWPRLIKLVSTETGYPVEMLSRDMRLAEDLGLDSIKMVEIAALVEEQLGAAPITADILASAQTLGDLCAALGSGSEKSHSSAAAPQAAPAPLPAIGGEDLILELVSAETGYPRDMLNLSMSLEADLGLDSIRKVEIMASLSERLPGMDMPDMSSIETLADLLKLMPVAAPSAAVEPLAAAPSPDLLLEIVSRETGYPADMLNWDMDLEADLGLDSIRRVEIMAALNEAMGADVHEAVQLHEARTLGDFKKILAAPAATATVEAAPPRRGPGRPPKNSPPAFKSSASGPEESQHLAALSAFSLEMKNVYPGAREERLGLRHGDVLHLLADDSPLAAELAKRLTAEGLTVVCAPWAQVEILAQAASPAGLALIWPQSNDAKTPLRAFRALKNAAQALIGAAAVRGVAKPLLLGLTFMGGGFGLTGTEIAPASAPASGLIKTAAREWEGVRAKVVDLPVAALTDPAAYIDSIRGAVSVKAVEVGISAPGRLASPALLPYKLKNIRVRHIREGQNILVTGGARGVTAAALVEVARAFRPHLIIMGRTPLPAADPYWLAGVEGEAAIRQAIYERAAEKPGPQELARQSRQILRAREIRANIAAMEKNGARVSYISGDLISPTVLRATLAEIKRAYGPIHGFIHGAGVLADSLITDKTDEDFELVFKTKMGMAETVLEELAYDPLHLVAFFSSSTARFGRRGQADYAAGNEGLNKLAKMAAMRHSCKSLAVNWGPWDGGMVDDSLKRLFEQEGIGLIPPTEGARLFASLIGTAKNDPVEVLVLGSGTDLSCLN